MRLYASEVCACRGAHLPTTGRVHLGLEQCRTCGRLRPRACDEVIRPAMPAPGWAEDAEDGRVTPSLERGARMSRYRMRRQWSEIEREA